MQLFFDGFGPDVIAGASRDTIERNTLPHQYKVVGGIHMIIILDFRCVYVTLSQTVLNKLHHAYKGNTATLSK